MLRAARDPSLRAVTAWWLAAGLAGVAIGVYIAIAGLRLAYPFELEWMEGATLDHVHRVLAGRPLYAAPSLDFIAFTYPPLYYYAAAALARALGAGFAAMRLVSIAASLGSFLCIYAFVRPGSGRRAAVVSAGLFAATYAIGGGWLDLGRVDSLYLCLALASGAVVAGADSPRQFAAAGVLAALALLTKQTIAVTIVFLAPYLLLRHTRGFLFFAAAFAAVGGGTELYLDTRSDGWFRYYVYTLPRMRMAISSRGTRLWTFVWDDMLRPLAPVLAAITFTTRRAIAGGSPTASDRSIRISLFAAGLILSSGLARLEGGAWTNALLPAYAAIAILFGITAGRVPGTLLAPAAAVLQFALLAYDPRPLVPTPRDAAAGRAVVERLGALPDGALVLDHGYLAEMAGKRAFAHGWAMTDVLWADHAGAGRPLEAEVRSAIAARRFPALVLDDAPHWFARDFDRFYARREELPDPQAFLPVSGSRRRPVAIYLPR